MKPLKWAVWGDNSIFLSKDILKMIGGKALELHELIALGYPVPSWATITSSLVKVLCTKDGELRELLEHVIEDPLKKGSLIRNRFKNMKIEEQEERALLEIWNTISEEGRKPVAIRSSAVDEDSKILSFAGQMDTILNVRGRDQFFEALRCCWASLFGDRAISYGLKNGINPWTLEIAVIVQHMIEPDVSGVIFSANPLTGDCTEMVVSSTWGLGEGLVSGVLDADTFILNSKGVVLKSDLREKKNCVGLDRKGGTKIVEVRKDRQRIASLKIDQLKTLHQIAFNMEKLKGMPMDIEFGIVKDKIYLLQARPITSLKECSRLKRDNHHVWDNSNIVESYSGVTTPLTFSFIKKAYFAVYWQFCEVIGVNKETIFKNRYLFENMLGLIHGRVYYNLLNWYRLVSLMPGFRYNKGFMEQMMGLQLAQDFNQTDELNFTRLMKLVKVGLKMLLAHLTLQRRIVELHTHFNKVYSYYSRLNFKELTPPETLKIYHLLEDEIIWKWKAHILNDFEAMIFYGLLKRLTIKWDLDGEGTLQNNLLCGQGGIKSTEVTTELFRIANQIEVKS